MANYAHMTELLRNFVKNSVPGCGCAFAKDGKILFEEYNGYADIESGKPVDQDTIYRLYSMTKVIVCTAAMMLHERGKFLLSDPLYEYFPEWKDMTVAYKDEDGNYYYKKAKNPILIKHALSMACGIPYAFGDSPTAKGLREVQSELTEKYGKYDIQTEVKAMGRIPLAFEPGTDWLYGYGHEIVAAMVDLTCGTSIGEFMQSEIFEPLGMKSTGYRYHDDLRERMITYYAKKDGEYTPIKGMMDQYHEPDAKYEMGGAGLYSSVPDYIKFSQMLANGGVWKGEQIIGRKTIDLMRANQLNEKQLHTFNHGNHYLAGYGYGLGVRTLMDQGQSCFGASKGEFGWTGASGTYLSVDPSEGFSLVYMHQMAPNEELYHHHRVRAAAYGCIK